MEMLGYIYSVGYLTRTRDFTLQTKLSFYKASQAMDTPLFEIYGCPNYYHSEVLESALVHALTYIDDILEFKLGDMNYAPYLFKLSGLSP